MFRTKEVEIFIVFVVLCFITFIFACNTINWITTFAVLFKFNHTQLKNEVEETHLKTCKYLSLPDSLYKSVVVSDMLWFAVFYLTDNYAGMAGTVLSIAYPIWRVLSEPKNKYLREGQEGK